LERSWWKIRETIRQLGLVPGKCSRAFSRIFGIRISWISRLTLWITSRVSLWLKETNWLIIDIWGYKDIRTIVVVIVGEFFPIICFVCFIPFVIIRFVPLYLLLLYFLSLYIFCRYTLCHFIPFVVIIFVPLYLLSLYALSFYTFCRYAFCLFIRYVIVLFVSYTFCRYTLCLVCNVVFALLFNLCT
jgi:hypothetical protein